MQFHPEVVHSPHGMAVLQRFLHDLAGCAPTWTMASIIDDQVAAVRAQVGDGAGDLRARAAVSTRRLPRRLCTRRSATS